MPSVETVWPLQSSTKSRLRQSGRAGIAIVGSSPSKTWFSTGVFQLDSLNSRKQIDSGHFTPTEGHFAATAD